MVKNTPCDAGVMGSIPCQGTKISTCPGAAKPVCHKLLSPCPTTRESEHCNKGLHMRQWRSCMLQLRPQAVKERYIYMYICRTSLVAQTVKRLPTVWETGFNPWVGKILWRRKWQPTPGLLPGKSHGWRSLVGYSPRGHKESDTIKQLNTLSYTHTHTHTHI